MRGWTKHLENWVFRQRATEETQAVTLLKAQPSTTAASELGTIDVEEWVERKAQELNGDWSPARLGGFSRGEDAAARQLAAAMLHPTEELALEFAPDELYSGASVRVRTLEGRIVGYLESSVSETVSRQMKEGELVRCFVYSVTLNERQLPSSILLAVVSGAFSPSFAFR